MKYIKSHCNIDDFEIYDNVGNNSMKDDDNYYMDEPNNYNIFLYLAYYI